MGPLAPFRFIGGAIARPFRRGGERQQGVRRASSVSFGRIPWRIQLLLLPPWQTHWQISCLKLHSLSAPLNVQREPMNDSEVEQLVLKLNEIEVSSFACTRMA